MTLGARIKFARNYAKLSHDRLGELAGTSRYHLIRLEKGLHRPKPAMIAAIVAATGVPAELLAGEDDSESGQPMGALLSRDEYALYGQLTARIVAAKSHLG